MARRFYLTLESVAPGDVVMSMQVGERLVLPRHGKIECGRVAGLAIQCRGQGQGGRRCFGLTVDGDRVVIHDYKHGIWVRDAHRTNDAELATGDAFGPCPGIRFVLGAHDDAPVLHDVRRVGRFWCANPRAEHQVWSAVDLGDAERNVVDVVLVEADEAWNAATTSGAFTDVLHPSWPVCIERFRFDGVDVRVGERTAGIALKRIVERTQAMGAAVDGGMAAWLAESVGWALMSSGCVFGSLDECVTVRFDDGQPILEPSALRIGSLGDDVATWQIARVLRDFGMTPANERVALALAAADDLDAGRAALIELLEALTQVREESGGDMRTAWHGLVQRLFPTDAAADRDVVDALRLLSEPDAVALLEEQVRTG